MRGPKRSEILPAVNGQKQRKQGIQGNQDADHELIGAQFHRKERHEDLAALKRDLVENCRNDGKIKNHLIITHFISIWQAISSGVACTRKISFPWRHSAASFR